MILAQITNTNLIPDIARVVNDVAPSLSVESIVAFVGALFLLARTLRKAVPDNLQNGKLGDVLKHIALEINPVTTTSPVPPADAPKPVDNPPIK